MAGGVGNAVVVFSRNPITGALTFVEALRDGVAGIEGLGQAWSVSLSPDGAHVYATGLLDDAVVTFGRDPTSGRLALVQVVRDGVDGVDGLDNPWLVTVSPDGANVYVAGTDESSVAVFAREPRTGTLTFLEVHADGVGGTDGLAGARGITVSPDGRHVYATGPGEDAVAIFRRSVCGDGRVEAGECCDLGAHNGAASTGCTATCDCTGRCTGGGPECAGADGCPPGEGCCGDGVLDTAETCDDGNLEDGDCCTARYAVECGESCVPACEGVSGPHLGVFASMRLSLRDTTGGGTFNRWKLRSGRRAKRTLGPGQSVDPATEDVRVVIAESDGRCPPTLRILGEFRLDADQCFGGPCWDHCETRPGTDDETCNLHEPLETRSDPDGVRLARIAERRDRLRFVFAGRAQGRILAPQGDRVRVCVHIGADARTAVLRCAGRGGRALACKPAPRGPR